MLKNLKVPNMLNKGDKAAVVASSWGGPACFPLKAEYGVKMIEENFGLKVKMMPFSTASAEEVSANPEKRAEDLMAAFKDDNVDFIISAIGGDDSIRLLPYIDFDVIANNPKPYIGYSDSTVTHFMCLKAGVRSYYGPTLMAGFAENGGLFDFMKHSVEKTLFSNEVIGCLENTEGFVIDQHKWSSKVLLDKKRTLLPAKEQKIINGTANAKGRLIGGCMEVLEFLKDTSLWDKSYFKDAILFLETSEDTPPASFVKYWMRNYAASGILKDLAGVIVGRPQSKDDEYINDQYNAILQVVRDEEGLDLPILVNCSFGHTDPQMLLPYGALAEIDIETATFSILESGVK